jgi:hypothetical protein
MLNLNPACQIPPGTRQGFMSTFYFDFVVPMKSSEKMIGLVGIMPGEQLIR